MTESNGFNKMVEYLQSQPPAKQKWAIETFEVCCDIKESTGVDIVGILRDKNQQFPDQLVVDHQAGIVFVYPLSGACLSEIRDNWESDKVKATKLKITNAVCYSMPDNIYRQYIEATRSYFTNCYIRPAYIGYRSDDTILTLS